MKRFSPVLLAVLVLLPVLALFVFDAKYLGLRKEVCTEFRNEKYLAYGCRDPELIERERIVSTAFYRHIADYFGREEGTSPSWLDSAVYDDGNSGISYEARSKIKQELGQFNRDFAAAMFLSVIIASVSGTILIQTLTTHRRSQ